MTIAQAYRLSQTVTEDDENMAPSEILQEDECDSAPSYKLLCGVFLFIGTIGGFLIGVWVVTKWSTIQW